MSDSDTQDLVNFEFKKLSPIELSSCEAQRSDGETFYSATAKIKRE